MLLFIVFLTSHWSHGDAQSCLPCIASQCSLDVSTCTHGAVKDYCGCCDECLKGPGEKCGGFFGSCANGSECIVRVGFGVSYILYVQTPGFCEGMYVDLFMNSSVIVGLGYIVFLVYNYNTS